MNRTDDEIRDLATVMQSMAVMDGITTLTGRMSSMRMHNTNTLAVVRDPDHRRRIGTLGVVGPYEVSPGESMIGRPFSIVVVADSSAYNVPDNVFKNWFDTSVRTRLEPGGIIVEAH